MASISRARLAAADRYSSVKVDQLREALTESFLAGVQWHQLDIFRPAAYEELASSDPSIRN